MTIDMSSWGYRRDMQIEEVLPIEDIILLVSSTVACGGNILINVGPTKEGVIAPIFEERLLQLGGWLGTNGEAIYNTQPWAAQNETLDEVEVWYTTKGTLVYAIVNGWPDEDILRVSRPVFKVGTRVTLLGNGGEELKWRKKGDKVEIVFPSMSRLVKKCTWCQWAYVVKMTNLDELVTFQWSKNNQLRKLLSM